MDFCHILFVSKNTVKTILHTYWTYVNTFPSAEQKPNLQVLESSNDQDHADGHVDVSEGAIGNYSNVICLNASPASHGVSQHTIHSQVASKGTGAVNVYTTVYCGYVLISQCIDYWHLHPYTNTLA
jgi:hypothetical protein